MIQELISKLKSKKQELIKVENTAAEVIEEEKEQSQILITKENNYYKMEISDYIESVTKYSDRMNEIDEFGIEKLICNAVLWNSRKQKVNKGIYYVIVLDNSIYNIHFNDNNIKIDERIKKDDITEEKIIRIDTRNSDYGYTFHKHDSTGDTFHTRFFNKNGFSFGKSDLSKEEFLEDINSLISNLQTIEEINNIFDINILRELIVNDLIKESNNKVL